jgi:hypothetical protein
MKNENGGEEIKRPLILWISGLFVPGAGTLHSFYMVFYDYILIYNYLIY